MVKLLSNPNEIRTNESLEIDLTHIGPVPAGSAVAAVTVDQASPMPEVDAPPDHSKLPSLPMIDDGVEEEEEEELFNVNLNDVDSLEVITLQNGQYAGVIYAPGEHSSPLTFDDNNSSSDNNVEVEATTPPSILDDINDLSGANVPEEYRDQGAKRAAEEEALARKQEAVETLREFRKMRKAEAKRNAAKKKKSKKGKRAGKSGNGHSTHSAGPNDSVAEEEPAAEKLIYLPVLRPGEEWRTGEAVLEKLGPAEIADERKPWHQLGNETDKAYEAFRIFLELGRRDRSFTRTYYIYHDKNPETDACYKSQIVDWGKQYAWHDRVNAYDAALDKRIEEELQDRVIQSRIMTADLGQSLRTVAADALSGLAETLFEIVLEKDPATGEQVTRRVLKHSLSPNEIVRLAETGVKLERMATGLDNDAGRGSGANVNVTVGVGMFQQTRPEDLREDARQILEAQDSVVDVTSRLLEGV